ncbi:MAG: hypothetical protein IKD10_01560, partial [Lentisphaeria bacterium]|nr:hypothetical protein [Lentisphaeria bacterium]
YYIDTSSKFFRLRIAGSNSEELKNCSVTDKVPPPNKSRMKKLQGKLIDENIMQDVPLQQLQLPMDGGIMRCPDCNSDDVIP